MTPEEEIIALELEADTFEIISYEEAANILKKNLKNNQ